MADAVSTRDRRAHGVVPVEPRRIDEVRGDRPPGVGSSWRWDVDETEGVRPGTTIVLAGLLVLILGAAVLQLFFMAH